MRAASLSNDVSSISDLEDDDYQTDHTSPAISESAPDEAEREEVEDFRDREYPQLKGCYIVLRFRMHADTLNRKDISRSWWNYTLCQVSYGGVLEGYDK